MANWVDIPESAFKEFFNSGNSGTVEANGRAYLTLQYDKDSVTSTSIKLRFVLRKHSEYELYDTFYVLLDPKSENDPGELHKLKTVYTAWSGKGKWPYYDPDSFIVTKRASAEEFIIPAFWFCDDGYNNTNPNASAKTFFKSYNNGNRWQCKTVIASKSLSSDNTEAVITDGSAITNLTIEDNGNNTAKVSGNFGTAGANNQLSSATVYYTFDNTKSPVPSTSYTFSKNLDKTKSSFSYIQTAPSTITTVATDEGKFIIKAKARSVFNYNTADTFVITKEIKYYVSPTMSGIPNITYTKSRLTIKEPWTLRWNIGEHANDNSLIRGYKIAVYKKSGAGSSFTNVLNIIDDTSKTGDPGDITEYRLEEPSKYFSPGDFVMFTVQAYTVRGDNFELWSNTISSSEYEVRNAGIVMVKTPSGYVEGQVYVRVKNASNALEWKEAETINVKTSDGWKESQ